jgi:hypothetical protein
MIQPPINETGPRCAWCGCRPDDPVWAQPAGQAKDLACLGCVADMRAKGERPRILGRAIFTRPPVDGLRGEL